MQYIKTDLEQLGLAYVDLLLIHAPGGETLKKPGCGGPCKTTADRQATYKGLEMALAANLTRSIGISNFPTELVKEILATAETPPAVNQCSMHVGGHDDDTIAFCQAHGITYEAYSPLGGDDLGGRSVMTYPQVKAIAAAHQVSAAQVALRWVMQRGCALATATGNSRYMAEDLQSLTIFTLTVAEMATLNAVRGKPPPR
jgi:diketogulonate reductase-like aldo/keto reductase